MEKVIEKDILRFLRKSKTLWTDVMPFIEKYKNEYSYAKFHDVLIQLMNDKRIIIRQGDDISLLLFKIKNKPIKNIELNFRLPYKEKEKWYNEKWIGYLLALIGLIFGFYQWYLKHEYTLDLDSVKKERDSLKSERSSLKLELDSCKYLLSDKIDIQQNKKKIE